MVFRSYLEQSRARPGRLRAHLGSGGLHALGLLLLLLLVRRVDDRSPPPLSRQALMVAVAIRQPRADGPGWAAPAPSNPVSEPRGRRALNRPRPTALPALPPPQPTPPAPAIEIAAGEASPPGGDGLLASAGLTAGTGDRPGEGGGGGRSMRKPELFARIIGSGIRPGSVVRSDQAFISLKEATALRTHDFFPRLPAALWQDRAPYLVALEVCVSAEGRVSEVALRSSASARLDPLVVAAVRGWRYRPRLQGGQPHPFCHGVLIRYELTY